MFISIIEFICWGIHHMFPEHRLLHDELNAFNRMAIDNPYVMMNEKIVSFSQTIVRCFAEFPRVNSQGIGYCVEPVE